MPKILHSLLPKSLHFWLPFTKAAPQPEYKTSGCYDPKLRELAEMARSASAVAEDDEPKEN